MDAQEMFVWGFAGSLAVEIVTLARHFESSHNHPIPERYKKISFWIVRLLLCGVGGGLAMAYGIDKPLLALHIGAATPLIIGTLGSTTPPGTPQLPPAAAGNGNGVPAANPPPVVIAPPVNEPAGPV